MNEDEKKAFRDISADMEDYLASEALSNLSDYLMRYYGKKVIILLDEYDTPMQEAYVGGYWNELVSFIRNLFNSTFKSNPYLERALMTGITVAEALDQIDRMHYTADLEAKGIPKERIRKYGFAFEGKKILIG